VTVLMAGRCTCVSTSVRWYTRVHVSADMQMGKWDWDW
jgi:hypothetical protein